jgi:hypothetical protein
VFISDALLICDYSNEIDWKILISKVKFGATFTISKIISISVIIFLILINLKFLLTAAINLRPIADDYCNAVAANTNIFSNLNYWFNLWSGDVFQIVIAYIVVGFPLVKLPIGIGSAFTLFCGLIALTTVIVRAFSNSSVNKINSKRNLFNFSLLFLVVTTSWLTFWWLPVLLASTNQVDQNKAEQYLTTILSWQTVNSPYVIQTCLSLLLTFYVLDRLKTKATYPTALLFGFLVGTSGYAVAVTLLVLSALELINSIEKSHKNNRNKIYENLTFLLTIILGIYFSTNSPGAINRKGQLASESNVGAILSVSINAIKSWIDLLFSGEALYVLLIGFLTFYLFTNLRHDFSFERIKLYANRLLLLSFFIFVISKVSELFSYSVFWHTIFSSTLLYLGLFTGGVSLAVFTKDRIKKIYVPIALTTLGSLLIVSMYALSQIETRVENRRAQWDLGPAPSVNGQPADREIPWINDCWNQLQQLKSD